MSFCDIRPNFVKICIAILQNEWHKCVSAYFEKSDAKKVNSKRLIILGQFNLGDRH